MVIKVLHLIDSGGLYGAEKMLLSLVEEQLRQGLEPMILSAGSPDIDVKPLEREARRLKLPLTVWRMKPGLNFSETKRIIDWAREAGFCLFHSHGYKFNILLGLTPGIKKKLPVFATLHGYVHAKPFSKIWLYERLDRVSLRNMRGVALVGYAMLQEVPPYLRQSKHVRVIPNGLSVEEIEKRSVEPLDPEIAAFFDSHDPVLLAVGRLSPEKGFDRLLPAFKELKNRFPAAGLLIVGEGKMRGCLEKLSVNLGLENSFFMPGYYSNVAALLARAKMAVVASFTEGLPISVLEAMAIKTPIVASAVGDIPKVLGNGLGGALVSKLDTNTLAKELQLVLTAPESTKQKTEWSYGAVKDYYSSEAMAEKYRAFYESGLQ